MDSRQGEQSITKRFHMLLTWLKGGGGAAGGPNSGGGSVGAWA